jgi:tetratricopeptide (TPR) repeat protein
LGQWGVVWEGLVDILRLDPDNEAAMKALVDIYSLELRNTGTFRRWVRSHIDSHGNNSRAMRNLAATLLAIGDLGTRVPDLALETASKAYDGLKTKDAAAVAVYAQALYNIGRLDGAIDKQEEAIALATVEQRKALRGTLDYYRLCKRLQESVN